MTRKGKKKHNGKCKAAVILDARRRTLRSKERIDRCSWVCRSEPDWPIASNMTSLLQRMWYGRFRLLQTCCISCNGVLFAPTAEPLLTMDSIAR